MAEFFRGRRRKAGIGALVLAVLLMGGWLRSLNVYDSVQFPSSDQTYHLLCSSPHWIGWTVIHNPRGSIPLPFVATTDGIPGAPTV